tara:strand:+ start:397 stop:648 length:252 start_codon:yes stop_codon:yes gene_type:complete
VFECCRFSEASVANKIMRMNCRIASENSGFLFERYFASILVTGTLIWWGGLGLRQLPFSCLGFTKIHYFGCLNLFSQWHQQVN